MVAENRRAGAVVIDNSSAWRMDPDVPLDRSEVNAAAVSGFVRRTSSPIELLDRAVVVALSRCTTRPSSSAPWVDLSIGLRPAKDAMDELFSQPRRSTPTTNWSTRIPQAESPSTYPEIDLFMEDG